jgi:hypothetical protein
MALWAWSDTGYVCRTGRSARQHLHGRHNQRPRRFGAMGGLFINVRFVRHGAYFSAWPQGRYGRLTKLVTDGGGLRAARQARLVRGAGATADRLRRPTQP